MSELKKCPFCGNEAILFTKPRYNVQCEHCGKGDNQYHETKENALSSWNMRLECVYVNICKYYKVK